MGKEFVIDNLEDMCALMCDNKIPTIKPDQVKFLADGDWQYGTSTVRCDNDHDCEHCDWVECPLESEE